MIKRELFVSYSNKDSKVVNGILSQLKIEGLKVWIDKEGIHGATYWRREIVEAIKKTPVVLVFLSKHSTASKHVMKELSLAEEYNKDILPILLEDGVEISPELKYMIAGVQFLNYYEAPEEVVKKIIVALNTLQGNEVKYNPQPSKKSNVPVYILAVVAVMAISLFLILQDRSSKAELTNNDSSQLEGVEINKKPIIQTEVQEAPKKTEKETVKPDLNGAWYIETQTTSSSHNKYIGMKIRFKILLIQEEDKITVKGEKIGEYFQGIDSEYSGKAKTPIELEGKLLNKGNGFSLNLSGIEKGLKREFHSMFRLTFKEEHLVGKYFSNAADTKGTARWIPEKVFLQKKWAN